MAITTFSSAEIVSVGTELLLGDILNTDTAYLARGLAELGIPCYHQSVVGDNPDRLRETLATALGRSELVIVTGGLGPTCDDLTKETATALMGKTLALHEPSYQRLTALLSARGIAETDRQIKQVMLPPDATVFDNDYGTAPGFAMEGIWKTEEGEAPRTMILLPGPPRELEPIYAERVRPYLAARTHGTLYSLNIGLYGIGEAAVEACLRDRMLSGKNPTVAPYCGEGEVRVRITAYGEDEEICRHMCLEEADIVRKTPCAPYKEGILDDYIFSIGSDDLPGVLVETLRERALTVSFVESCTGGYLAKRITDIPGASEVLSGSFVTYSEKTKMSMVGVRAETLSTYSVYSEEVAIEMAEGARNATGADLAVGVTGIAGPDDGARIYRGKEEALPAGTVFYAVTDGTRTETGRLYIPIGRRNPKEAREYVRRRASSALIFALLRRAEEPTPKVSE